MALARGDPLNPLRMSGTALPPNVLLMAKLVTLCFLLTQWRKLPRPYLPFLPIFDKLASPAIIQNVLKAAFLGPAVLLLCNRMVRTSSVAMAAVVGLSLLSSRLYFGNNRTFTACILFLTGLQQPGRSPWLVRRQVALVYFGATINKLLDSDWRSGRFFETWTARTPHHLRLRSRVPMAPHLMSWLVIAVELFLTVAFSYRRLYPIGIWTGVVYHTALLVDTGSTFNMFYPAMLSSYLAFADWPTGRVRVEYNSASRALRLLRSFWARIDLERTFDWRPRDRHRGAFLVTAGKQSFRDWSALTALALYNPVTYVISAILVSLLPSRRYLRWLAPTTIGIFSPFAAPIGDRVLGWVAGRSGRPCRLPGWGA